MNLLLKEISVAKFTQQAWPEDRLVVYAQSLAGLESEQGLESELKQQKVNWEFWIKKVDPASSEELLVASFKLIFQTLKP